MNRTTVLTLIALSLLVTAGGDAAARIPRLDLAAALGSCAHVDEPEAFFVFFGVDDATGTGAALAHPRHGVSFVEGTC
jgi:hypothetical protein